MLKKNEVSTINVSVIKTKIVLYIINLVEYTLTLLRTIHEFRWEDWHRRVAVLSAASIKRLIRKLVNLEKIWEYSPAGEASIEQNEPFSWLTWKRVCFLHLMQISLKWIGY